MRPLTAALAAMAVVWSASTVGAQTISQRGFLEGRGVGFPQTAPNDPTRGIVDVLFREEVFLKPADWIQLAAGLDLRANSHDQVDDRWQIDFLDRGVRRPRLAVRRLTATITKGRFTLDAGKQFIRWGRTDVLTPTDRFAPRDFLNVLDTDFLPVVGVRSSLQVAHEAFEVVWVPRLTPSRLPLFDQRWAVRPTDLAAIPVVDAGSAFPAGSQQGVRWRHIGERLETAVSAFDGFNHLPIIAPRLVPFPAAVELTRFYPTIRTYGVDLAVPTSWLTFKGEAAYFTSPPSTTEEYVLYVLELERQVGEWLLDLGYAGEVLTKSGQFFFFAPDRGIARSIIGRAAYTVDPKRTIAVEGAARQSGAGLYVKGDFIESLGQRWRLTLTGVVIRGREDDFLGQYRRNSHGSVALRFSF